MLSQWHRLCGQRVGCVPESIFLEEVAHFTNATTKYIKLEYLQGWEGMQRRFAQKAWYSGITLLDSVIYIYLYNIMVEEVKHDTRLSKLDYCTRGEVKERVVEILTWLNPFEIPVWVCILLFFIMSPFSTMSNFKKFKVLYSIYFFVICCKHRKRWQRES